MDINANCHLSQQKDDEFQNDEIQTLRTRFLQDFDAHPELYDMRDREKIVKDDYWVGRFLHFLDQGSDRALAHMMDTFRWRKSFGVNSFSPLEIPREIYIMAPLFEYYPDLEGRRMFYVRVKMHRQLPQIEERIKKSFIYYMEQMDTKAHREFGINLVFDMTSSGYSNADLDMMFFLLPAVRKHYPNAVKHLYVVGLPWILNSLATFALALVPSDSAKKIKFMTQKEFHGVIPTDLIPDFLGGTGARNYRRIPIGAKDCIQLGRELYGMDEHEVNKMVKPSLKYINEGMGLAIEENEDDE